MYATLSEAIQAFPLSPDKRERLEAQRFIKSSAVGRFFPLNWLEDNTPQLGNALAPIETIGETEGVVAVRLEREEVHGYASTVSKQREQGQTFLNQQIPPENDGALITKNRCGYVFQSDSYSPLDLAIKEGKIDIANHLIDIIASINPDALLAHPRVTGAFYLAIILGYTEIVNQIIERISENYPEKLEKELRYLIKKLKHSKI